MSEWQKKIRPGDKLKGIPAGFYNAVVDLASPGHVPAGEVPTGQYEPFFWVRWKNTTGSPALKGMATRLGNSFFDVDGSDNATQKKNYARQTKQIAFDYPEHANADSGVFSSQDYHPGEVSDNSSSETSILSNHNWPAWGFAVENIPVGKVGRVAVQGLFYVPLRVRHPAMHFCHSYGAIPHWAMTSWHGPATGEILWESEDNARFPTNFSPSQIYQDRMAIVRLGSASCSNIICFTSEQIPACDYTDAVNPTPGIGRVTPIRFGFPLSSPRRRGDLKLHAYAYNWNGTTSFINYDDVRVINPHQIPIAAGVYTVMDWDANSRVFVIRPPGQDYEAFYSHSSASAGAITNWAATSSVGPLDMTYSAGIFTANKAMRLSVDAVDHLLYSSGTAPFEASFYIEKGGSGGGSFSDYDWAFNPIVAAGIRHAFPLLTHIDLAEGERIRFSTLASGGGNAITTSFGRLKMRRVLKA